MGSVSPPGIISATHSMKLPPTIDRYEVIDRLGRGGMGIVYRARDPRLGRTVAVKVLATNDEEFRQRFLQEAQLAATLHHKNIVTVFDYGEQGRPVIVIYIEGATIADYLLPAPLPLPESSNFSTTWRLRSTMRTTTVLSTAISSRQT